MAKMCTISRITIIIFVISLFSRHVPHRGSFIMSWSRLWWLNRHPWCLRTTLGRLHTGSLCIIFRVESCIAKETQQVVDSALYNNVYTFIKFRLGNICSIICWFHCVLQMIIILEEQKNKRRTWLNIKTKTWFWFSVYKDQQCNLDISTLEMFNILTQHNFSVQMIWYDMITCLQIYWKNMLRFN